MAIVGTLIDNKYEVLKEIGHGGMSTVYLAMDTRLNKQWAIKELKKQAKDRNNEVVIQSAIAEANMIKRLDHPALPRIVDIIDEVDFIYVIMDYIEGETLEYVVNQSGAQSQEIVINWAKQLTEALYYLHTRTPAIIYRDMKPSNVMLKPDGNLKVIDFGIAREYKAKNVKDTICLGTRGYAAPEQFGGKGQTDPRTDIYCLGVTLYHLVTGQNPAEPPYEIYPIRYWNNNLSGGLENIIEKCTQLNPEDRYQSCAELLYDLEHYEEVDDAYKNKQRKKIKRFITTAVLSILFFVAGIGAMFAKNSINKSDYLMNLNQADKATDGQESRSYCIQAISILPSNPEAYLKLIEVYKDNNSFSVDEATEFKEEVGAYISDLETSNEYGNVAFNIGKLYWYYYDYGDNDDEGTQITKMINAVNWFDDAFQNSDQDDGYHKTSKIYRDIGYFYKDLQIKINEGSSVKELYKNYFSNLEEMYDMALSEKESEIVNLEIYKLIINSFENYARDFKEDGVTNGQMVELYKEVSQAVTSINTNSSKTKKMKNYILSRLDSANRAIENANIDIVTEVE